MLESIFNKITSGAYKRDCSTAVFLLILRHFQNTFVRLLLDRMQMQYYENDTNKYKT